VGAYLQRAFELATYSRVVVWGFNVNRILKSVVLILATIYLLVDAVFMTVARPFANGIAAHRFFGSLRARITSLRPYPTLALFTVPLIVLEPVKPVAAYLAATGHIAIGATVLVVGEILKLVIVERLFSISRHKLISIPAFAWTYARYLQATGWLKSFEAWQAARRWTRLARHAVRSSVGEVRAFRGFKRVSCQHG
jgi:hypothetical protein